MSESRLSASIVAEDVKQTENTDSAEGAEFRALVGKAELGEVYEAVVEHRVTSGAVAELQAHHKIGPNQIPLDLLRVEERAVTPAPTNTGATEQAVVSAVFANSVGSFLSVDQPTVPDGDAVYPVITSRATVGGPHTDDTVVAETTGSFEAELLKPSRIQAAYQYSRTDASRFGSMSNALREKSEHGAC